MRVTVGPVIGKVTTSSGRVLAEFDGSGRVTCELVPLSGRGRRQSDTVKVIKHRPFVFKFSGLEPDTRYRVSFTNATQSVASTLKTFSPAGPRKVVAISCNKLLVTQQQGLSGHNDLWFVLNEKFVESSEVELALHMGDQVYADSDLSKGLEKGKCTYVQARRLVDSGKLKGSRLDSALREMYRQDYRASYTHPPTAAVLANVSNLMVNDDHELRDDWGDRPEDRDPDSKEHRIARAAMEAYYGYQRQLHDDVDFEDIEASIATGEHHMHRFGDIGVLFTETRFCKGFNLRSADKKVPYLGSTQWRDIDDSLAPGGFFDKTRLLLVVAPTPIVFFTTAVNSTMAKIADDLEGHWSAPDYRKEQARILHAFNAWRQADRNRRDTVLLGGDVHMGGFTTVYFPDRTSMQQMTSSAIANALLNPLVYSTTRAGQNVVSTLDGGLSFSHGSWTRQRNFGILDIKDTASGGLTCEGHLVTPRNADIFRIIFCCGMAASYNKPRMLANVASGGGRASTRGADLDSEDSSYEGSSYDSSSYDSSSY